jgi:uncharacterized protein (UPF0333 family)
MKSQNNQDSHKKSHFLNSKGQVLVEYMLLLLISVSFATLIVSKLISRKDGDGQGIIIQSWSKMLQTLGNDLPDCPKQTDFNSAKCN